MGNVIDKDNIEAYAYGNIFDILDNRSYIVDPRHSGETRSIRKFVYDSDPPEISLDFNFFPYIILELPDVVTRSDSESGDGKYETLEWTQKIVVRTVRGGSSNSRTDAGRTDMLQISDDIQSIFRNVSIRESLAVLNQSNVEIEKISTDAYSMNERTIHEAEFEIRYNSRIKVSE